MRFRADHVPIGTIIRKYLKAANATLLSTCFIMFKTSLGAIDDEENVALFAYKTASGMFTNFKYIENNTPKVRSTLTSRLRFS